MPYHAKTVSAYTHKPQANLTNEDSPRIDECDGCGSEYPTDSLNEVTTYNATEETPAEYAYLCQRCYAPSEPFGPMRTRESRYYRHYRGSVAVPDGPTLPR